MHIKIFDRVFIVDEDISAAQLKVVIENSMFLPSNSFSLLYGSRCIDNGSLTSFGVVDNSLIDVIVLAEDGMRAKWRKKRIRRLRRKRRKMRNRAK